MKSSLFLLLAVFQAAVSANLIPNSNIKTTTVTPPGKAPMDVCYPSGASYKKAKYPTVAVLQGANVQSSQYSGFCKQLARYGFVVFVPNQFRTGPPPGYFATVNSIVDVLDYAKSANADSSSPLYGIVNTRKMGVSGHSFGSVAGLCAGAKDGESKCLPIFYSGAYTKPKELKAGAFYGLSTVSPIPPNALLDLKTTGFPVAMIQGTEDGINLPANAVKTYATLEKPKAYIKVKGANHYGITNTQPAAQPPPAPQDGTQTLTQTQSINAIAKWAGLWLRYHLLGDKDAHQLLKKAYNVKLS